nr:pyridoxal phosphate-dependent aminotransferase [Egibacter rhizosphaerae]
MAGLTESATLAITAKAKALRADGADVIGFGAGEPDAHTPTHIVEAAQAAAADPATHRYSAAGGLPELKAAIAADTERHGGRPTQPAEVLVTNGGKHALYAVFQTLLDPGDEALLPAPYWVSYPEQIRLAGATPVELPASADAGYRVTVEQLDAAVTDRTKLLIFNSPANPTGAVYPPDEVSAIGRWALDRGIWVVCDEIYEHLVYGDAQHASMVTQVPELSDQCILANGVAKTYAMTGWRVGWAIAPQPVSAAMGRLQSHTTSNVANIAQHAAIAALNGPRDEVERMRATFDRRRRLAYERLRDLPGLTCPLPEGAFYVFPSVEGLLGTEVAGRRVDTSLDLCEVLLDTARVALVPGEGFGAPGHVRLSYALGDDDLERGLDRIRDLLTRA